MFDFSEVSLAGNTERGKKIIYESKDFDPST